MKKVNWLDHLANLLVVILGISIAFYLEGYKEDTANKEQERKYLASLIKDLESDIRALDTLQIVNEMISSSIVKLSDATVGVSYDSDSLSTYLLSTQYNPPFSPQRTTYESLKASGKMELIEDFEIRNRVIELYEQYYRGAEQYDEEITQNLRDFYKPFYMKNIAFTGRTQVDKSFLSNQEFKNIIFSYRFLFVAKSNFYDTLTVEVRDVVKELQRYSINGNLN